MNLFEQWPINPIYSLKIHAMTITKKTVEKIIRAYIESERANICEHEVIADFLKANEGKEFDGRTFAKKRLPEGLKFEREYGMYYLTGRVKHLLGYSQDVVDVAKFEERDSCAGNAARERIEKLENIDRAKLLKLFRAIEKHWEGLRAAFGDVERENMGSYHNPVYYELLRAIQPDESGDRNPQLYEMYYLRK